ncbi:uncharacterized protein [Dermacentor albipictus]|uniref:uncharacterized protein isoform X3 n=1 Tax=Dermacentor albipictus TaxID=60249 RepID=UPI0038FC4AE9
MRKTRLPGHDNGPQWSVCNANTRYPEQGLAKPDTLSCLLPSQRYCVRLQLRPLLQIFCKLQPWYEASSCKYWAGHDIHLCCRISGASLQHAIPFDTPTCRDVLPFVGKPEMPQSY